MTVVDAIRAARDRRDLAGLVACVPYARFMGISATVTDGDLVATMTYADHLIGNANLPALHGGGVGALLESAAIFEILWRAESVTVPKTINITVEYLRSGRAEDTFARASFTRLGRRVANMRVVAWQDDPGRPIAAASAHFLLERPDEG